MNLAILATAGILGVSYIVLKNKQDFTPLEKELLALPDSEYLLDYTRMLNIRGHFLRIIDIPGKKPDQPLLLFIHGLGGQASQWEEQLEYFSHHASRVVALDLLGCGSSQVVSDWESYDTDELVADIEALLNTQDTSHGIIAIGHSYGCVLSTILATRITLKGLILVCCPKFHLGNREKRGQKLLPFLPNWVINRARRKDRQGGLYSESVNRLLSENVEDEGIRRRQLRWNLMSRTPVYKRFMSRADLKSPELFKKISTDCVLLIGASEDKLAPSSNMELIEKYLKEPPTRLLIQGAGHMPMITHTEQVNSAIQEFLLVYQ
ncbi:Alpha/Beta hydrolase protein [Phascolomyces articulosus]|uniref:Alpha/Beta hydrolase protein n=1 Tax=Phascolomyces articulosus TaxID=60185 RepID=A0AAD5JWY4_9FUNG|nr:Alpha/Beta hydrolase protein [Phascolomyces articulosus]